MTILRCVSIVACCGLVLSCAHAPGGSAPMARFEGQMLDGHGNPLDEAWISLTPDRLRTFRRLPLGAKQEVEVHARPDSLGRFSLSCPKGFYFLEAGGKGVARIRLKQIELSKDLRRQVIRFDGAYLTGRVAGSDGLELRHVDVKATGVNSRDRMASPGAEYSGASPYRLLLQPGRYRLRVYGQDGPMLAPLDSLVTVSDRDDSLNVVLSGHTVSVQLKTNIDLQCSNLRVSFFGLLGESYQDMYTDDQGLAVGHARTGRYSIVVRPLNDVTPPWRFQATLLGDTVLSYEMIPVRWTGVVKSSTTRAPISANLYLYQPDQRGATWRVQCDSTGRFDARIQPGVTYDVLVESRYENSQFPLSLDADSTFDVYLTPRPKPAPSEAR